MLGAPGNCDGNGAVDLGHYSFFGACLVGPDVVPSATQAPTLAACLVALDFDDGTDVDLEDHRAFQGALPD
jgi:hypothetical protein